MVGAGLAGLLLLPFGWPYFSVSKAHGLRRSMGEVIQYSADPLSSYVLPNNRSVLYHDLEWGAEYAPLPGEERLFAGVAGLVQKAAGASVLGRRYGEGISYRDFHGIWTAGEEERRLFPGFSVVILVILGLRVGHPHDWRGKRALLALLMLAMAILSLGPVLVVLGHLTYVPGPYAVLYYLMPGLKGMRATARFGYVALLAAAALSAYGWRHARGAICVRLRGRGGSDRVVGGVLLLAWLGLFSLENLPAERRVYERPADPPGVYGWLKEQTVEGGLIEIPTFKGTMRKTDLVYGSRRVLYAHREYLYMYYSIEHWHPIYNSYGAFISPLQFEIRDAVEALPDPKAVSFLTEQGLHTLVLHEYWFEPEDEAFWSRPEVREAIETIAVVDGAEVCRLR